MFLFDYVEKCGMEKIANETVGKKYLPTYENLSQNQRQPGSVRCAHDKNKNRAHDARYQANFYSLRSQS